MVKINQLTAARPGYLYPIPTILPCVFGLREQQFFEVAIMTDRQEAYVWLNNLYLLLNIVHVDSIDFGAARWRDPDDPSASWRRPIADQLVYLMTALGLETAEAKYLEMLAFDDSGIHEYPEGRESERRLSEYIIACVPDRQKIIRQLIVNLQSGRLIARAVLNHLRLLAKLDPLGLNQFLEPALDDPAFDNEDRKEIVALAVSVQQGMQLLKRKLAEYAALPSWSKPALQALTDAKDNGAIR